MDAMDAYRPIGIAYQPPRLYDIDECNSPCPHVSGWWLPEGCREMPETWRWAVRAASASDDEMVWRWLRALDRVDSGFEDM
jgi:hypothetical protein